MRIPLWRYHVSDHDLFERHVRVLVTGAGGPAAVSVMKSLGNDPTVDLVAADMDPWASGLYLVRADARTLIPAGLEPGPALAVTLDKLALARRCEGHVRVPRTECFDAALDPGSWTYPVVVKPR